MIRLFGADKFLTALLSRYLVYMAGGVGTGKTSFAVAISGMLHEWGLVDATISNLPIAWAVPAEEAPLERVAIVIDELGTWFSARDFGSKQSNEFMRALLGFPRKVGSYVIVASRINVDVTFRALSVQREYDFGPLQIYAFAEDDGQQQATGRFAVWGLNSLYASPLIPDPERFPRGYTSSYYATKYIPSGLRFLADWVTRAVAASKDKHEYDPNSIRALADGSGIFRESPPPPARDPSAVRPAQGSPSSVPASSLAGSTPSESVLSAGPQDRYNVPPGMDTHPLGRRL